MKPCLYAACLAPSHCKAGDQECHVNAYACTMLKQDQLRLATGKGIGHTYMRVCIGANIGANHNDVPIYEQVEI